MSADSSRAEVSLVSFESLKLRPGTALQIQHAKQNTALGEVQLLAAVRGQNVMVALKGDNGVHTGLEAGKDYVIRGFSGQHDFSFSSHVTQTFKAPFPYAMLAYPSSVEARAVRKVARTKTSLAATASPLDKDMPLNVTLADLSLAGAMIGAPSQLGAPGNKLRLKFTVDFEGNQIELSLAACIRYVKQADDAGYNVGVEFENLNQNDKLALHYATQKNVSEGADIVIS